MPTETNGHGDALYFMVKTWAGHKTTETLLTNAWQLVVLGGLSLRVILNKKQGVLKNSPVTHSTMQACMHALTHAHALMH